MLMHGKRKNRGNAKKRSHAPVFFQQLSPSALTVLSQYQPTPTRKQSPAEK